MNKDKIRLVINQIRIEDKLGESVSCCLCGSTNVQIKHNHVYCDGCKKFNKFDDALVHNLGIKNRDKFIKKLIQEAADIKEEKDFLEKISAIKESDIEIEEFSEILLAKPNKTLTLVKAPTGCGKTYSAAKYAIAEVERGDNVAIIVPTIQEVKRVIGLLKGMGYEDVSPVVRTLSLYSDENLKVEKLKSIVVSTYAYLSAKGHSSKTYKIAEKILKDRIVICDEIHVVPGYSNKVLPFAARYYEQSGSYRLSVKCRKAIRQGGCDDCVLMQKFEKNTYDELQPYESLPVGEHENNLIDEEASMLFKPEFFTDGSYRAVLSKKIDDYKVLLPYLKNLAFLESHIPAFEDMELRIQFPYEELESGIKRYTKLEIKEILENEKETKN